ncbi:MAG: Mur ligase family protein, partial [Anaerolineae bacterium]
MRGPVTATTFPRYCFDSRVVGPGELFLAVRTDRGDGHDFIAAACRGGAAGVVCERPPEAVDLEATCIVVPDTRRAIEAYAAAAVRHSGVRVLAITGSAGKTSTKEAVAHVLAGRFRVFRNPGNYSGQYGLAIALGELADDHEVAVLEMATDHFGEIAALVEMAPPEAAVVTAVAPAHLAAFRDLPGVAKEKGALVAALPPEGLAVLNADDPLVMEMAGRTRAPVAT